MNDSGLHAHGDDKLMFYMAHYLKYEKRLTCLDSGFLFIYCLFLYICSNFLINAFYYVEVLPDLADFWYGNKTCDIYTDVDIFVMHTIKGILLCITFYNLFSVY